MEPLPDYCCAILRLGDGRFVCERRPDHAPRAPGRATCFGGHREEGEEPLACLLRELQEETGWQPAAAACRHVITLQISPTSSAWFYLVAGEPPVADFHPEPGFAVEFIDEEGLEDPTFSDWHRRVLQGWLRGETRVAL